MPAKLMKKFNIKAQLACEHEKPAKNKFIASTAKFMAHEKSPNCCVVNYPILELPFRCLTHKNLQRLAV